jgi:predicted dehydrogenase
MQTPIRIGCLGAARIAPQAIVHPTQVRGDVVLQSISARDPKRAQAFAERYGFKRALPHYADVIADPDVDLIYNPLPIDQHAEWSVRALNSGKHVLCEKPFAMNVKEARTVLDAARANGKRVIEAFHYRYHPAFAQMLDWIQTGRIGDVREISAAFDVPIPYRSDEIRHHPESGGGAFMDLGCYPLSWTLAIVGAAPLAIEAHATLTPRGVDESLEASLRFENGVTASLSASMAATASFRADLIVRGAHGEIHFNNPLAPHRGASLGLQGDNDAETAVIDRFTTYTHQFAAVIAALRNDEPLPTEGAAIMRQQEALDAIYVAAGLQHLRFVS